MKWGPGLEHSLRLSIMDIVKSITGKICSLESDMRCESDRSAKWDVPTSSPGLRDQAFSLFWCRNLPFLLGLSTIAIAGIVNRHWGCGVVFYLDACCNLLVHRPHLVKRGEKKKNWNQHQLNDIAGIGGYLSSNTGGDHLSEPPVEVEVLPRHRPHKVHTVLFGNVVDVTEAGVILKLSNWVVRKARDLQHFWEMFVCANMISQDVDSHLTLWFKIPGRCSSHRIQWCWGGIDRHLAKWVHPASHHRRCGNSGRQNNLIWNKTCASDDGPTGQL